MTHLNWFYHFLLENNRKEVDVITIPDKENTVVRNCITLYITTYFMAMYVIRDKGLLVV